jgi:hypothetical protein
MTAIDRYYHYYIQYQPRILVTVQYHDNRETLFLTHIDCGFLYYFLDERFPSRHNWLKAHYDRRTEIFCKTDNQSVNRRTGNTMAKCKSTYIYLPNITQKSTIKATRTTLSTGGEFGRNSLDQPQARSTHCSNCYHDRYRPILSLLHPISTSDNCNSAIPWKFGCSGVVAVPQNIHIKDRTPLKPGMTPDAHEGKQFLHH